MGLSITVGVLAELQEDEESLEEARQAFQRWNEALRLAGIDEFHLEPEGSEPAFGADMGGYDTLHHCRRAAAHLWKYGRITPAGDDSPTEDAAYVEYLQQMKTTPCKGGGPSFWAWTPANQRGSFDHLIHHSDSEGIYLPLPFDRVLGIERGEYDEYIGSVTRLFSECKTVARALALPPEVLVDLDIASEGLESPERWGGFGREALGLAVLMAACRASNKSGAALGFH